MPGPVNINTVKCVVIGDGAVGKTCLLISYAKGDFPRDYVPTVFDNYAVAVEVGGQKITLHLLDTAGNAKGQCVAYAHPYVARSMENIRDKWHPELRRYSPNVPFILVGTQADRRPNQGASSASSSSFVAPSEGLKLAKEIGAIGYFECSALTRDGLREVFVNAILAALDPKKAKATGIASKTKKCSIV